MKELPTDYQKFIHSSRYARFRDDLGRRETWDETVTRFFDYFVGSLDEKHGYKPSQTLVSELKDAVSGLHVMPSMRALMTAGEAAKRENLAIYNCSYVPIDSIRAFGETLYILMCGTGVGFSVERQTIKSLPEVPHELTNVDETLVVRDSKRGWAEAYETFVERLFKGEIIKLDYSEVRPKGARLMVFGGRASGPEPLAELMEFTLRMFHQAKGRQLKSAELHEIICKIGSIVVVGGVRRAALISLSNLSDLRMRDVKAGDWYTQKPHLGLANNSAAYTEKPEPEIFMEEWLALYKSKSGERGIFNRHGAIRKLEHSGRRDPGFEFGTNPCGEIILRPRGLCNLTEAVVRGTDTPNDLKEKIRLASILGTWQSTQTSFNFVRPEWQINAEEERLLGVSLTGIYANAFMRGDEQPELLNQELRAMKATAIAANGKEARQIGIPIAAAVTTIKPSGTVSKLVNTPPGIHHGHAQFFINRISQDIKDPITKFLIDQGMPHEPHYAEPDNMVVFAFPMKLEADVKTREQDTALGHAEMVKRYNLHWSEHAVSCTVNIRENEWPQLGGWVYDNFDELTGMSFLPYFEGDSVYKQKPLETIDELTYHRLVAEMPQLDWSKLGGYEAGEDHVTGTQELACVGGVCDITAVGLG